MKRPAKVLSERGKRYRKYLLSDHWKELRGRVLERDGGKCVRCEEAAVQVHHTVYRERWEDALLEDLESLCIGCHRAEHGFSQLDAFDRAKNKLERIIFSREVGEKPPPESKVQWKALHRGLKDWTYYDDFGVALFWHCLMLGWERERAWKLRLHWMQIYHEAMYADKFRLPSHATD